MNVTIVHIHVKPDCVEAFKDACAMNHEASVREAGNHRFDVLQADDEPNRFVLYEAYATKAQAAAHRQTAHYSLWRETVAEMMAEPRKGVVYTALKPTLG